MGKDQQDIIIDAQITAVQPLSFTLPDVGFPKMTVYTPTGAEETAYIPASTLRGKLRRLAFAEVAEALFAAGKPASLDAYYLSAIGQTRESEEKEQDKIDLLALEQRRDRNPIASLFGAGLGLASKVQFSHGLPLSPVLPIEIRSARKDASYSDFQTLDETAKADWVKVANANAARSRFDARADAASAKLRKLRATGGDAEQIAQLEAAIQANKAKANEEAQIAGGTVSVQQPLSHEAIPPGVTFKASIRGFSLSLTEIGVLLRTIQRFSLKPQLGAQVARGCGEISIRCTVRSRATGAEVWEDCGSISIGKFQPAQVEEKGSLIRDALIAQHQMVKDAVSYEWAPPKRAAAASGAEKPLPTKKRGKAGG
jgi:CRISPR type IV-associated protein Csf2